MGAGNDDVRPPACLAYLQDVGSYPLVKLVSLTRDLLTLRKQGFRSAQVQGDRLRHDVLNCTIDEFPLALGVVVK